MTLNLIESRIYDSPVSKANEPKKKKNNKVTLCKQRHRHHKH